MVVSDITALLEQWAPMSFQESYDNAGLITGHPSMELTGVLVCLDSTETVIDEAIHKGCNLIIAHHPIVFKGLKSLTGRNYVERTIIKAVQNNVAIYAIHTNLDNVYNGVNHMFAAKLGLVNCRVLLPKNLAEEHVYTVPVNVVGRIEEELKVLIPRHQRDIQLRYAASLNENYIQMSVICDRETATGIVEPCIAGHFEAACHNVTRWPVSAAGSKLGAGLIGELNTEMEFESWLEYVQQSMQTPCIRHTAKVSEKVSKIAVCGGSGAFLLPHAIAAGADVYITADFKYHEFFDADGRIVIMDIGHYESEQFTVDLIAERIVENFPNFAVFKTEVVTNPVHYFSSNHS